MHLKYSFLSLYFMFFISSTVTLSAHNSIKFDQAIASGLIKVNVSKKNLENLHKASTLVISCVDFRLRDEVTELLNVHLGLLDDYDEIALPGASLGLEAPQYVHWKNTIEDVIGLLQSLHHIQRIILIDHRGCGAYKLVKGQKAVADRNKEYESHRTSLLQARSYLNSKFPKLEVYSLLMGLDGIVEVIK